MSRVEEPGVCYCACHEPNSYVMHCSPCCKGKCPICKKRYKSDIHVAECQKRIDDLIAEHGKALGG